MIRAYSQNVDAIRKRIERLPKYVLGIMEASARRDAVDLISTFQDGIRFKRFGLEQLRPGTVAAKRAKDQALPDTPLYGEGFDEKDSLINALEMKKVKSGWRVKARKARHHGSKLTLAQLLDVHEYGCTIANGFGKGTLVRIPPRPAMRYAYKDVMFRRMKRDPGREIQKAIVRYVNVADAKALERVRERLEARL